MSYERKEKRKQEPRVDFFSLNPKWKGLFYGVISFLGAIVIWFTFRTEWKHGWYAVLDSLSTNVFALFLSVGLVFMIGESILSAVQFFMGNRMERNQTEISKEIAEEIRNAVARHNTPVWVDEIVKKEAFRVLQKRHRPKFLFLRKWKR